MITPQDVTSFLLNVRNADYLRHVRDTCNERLDQLSQPREALRKVPDRERATKPIGQMRTEIAKQVMKSMAEDLANVTHTECSSESPPTESSLMSDPSMAPSTGQDVFAKTEDDLTL